MGIFTPTSEEDSELVDAHWLENARCYSRESIRAKTDGWKGSKLALENLVGISHTGMKKILVFL